MHVMIGCYTDPFEVKALSDGFEALRLRQRGFAQ